MLATFAGGCFWCTEAIFKRLKGVKKVTPGYSGGNKNDPSYDEVSSESTGHTESIQIEFDPKVISYKQLVEVFFKTHDPTTLNKQGNDVGTQYRSVIFYHSPEQKKIAESLMKGNYVTEIVEYKNFFEAEGYHHDYYDKNKSQPYCRLVIDPKIQKLYKDFGGLVKE